MKIVRILALLAVILAGYITWTSFSGTDLAGCGQEGGGCDEVIQTRWGKWLGIPVSAGGLLVYTAILITSLTVSSKPSKKKWLFLAFLSILAAGSALWFAALQLFVIKNICYFCMAVHACGVIMTILIWKNLPFSEKLAPKELKKRTDWIQKKQAIKAGLVGILAVAILILGQAASKQTLTASVPDPAPPPLNTEPQNPPADPAPPETTMPAPTSPETSNAPDQEPVSSEMSHREITLLNGSMRLTLGEYPMIGSPGAERIAAAFLDYTCPACRQLHPALEQAVHRSPGRIGIVVLPMPLDAVCNPGVRETSYQHQNACMLWRIALAVWNTNSQVFPTFDQFMFESEYPPTAQEALAAASKLVGQQAMEDAMANARLSELIRKGIGFFTLPQITKKSLPTLVSETRASVGVTDASQLLFELESGGQ